MNKLNQSQFADKYDVSRQNIHSRIREGNLILGRDKLIDQTNPTNKKWIEKNEERKKHSDDQKQDPLVRAEESELKKSLTRERIKKLEIENKTKRGILIHRDKVASFISKIHQIDESRFKNLGHTVTPEIIAVGGIDESKSVQIQAIIEDKVWDIIRAAKRLGDECIASLGEDDD